MNRNNIIVVESPNGVQAWGNFKRACEENTLPYHSLKMKKFPIYYHPYVIHKVRFNEI